ncbi:MAG: CAP domain-containing protein [Pseudonocardiaceae bacterium]
MIPPRPSRLAPLLASLAVGAILAGAGLTLAVDTPRSALLDGTNRASDPPVVPAVDLAPAVDVPATANVPPTVDVSVDIAPQPLPATATPDSAAPGAEPGILTRPPTPPKAAPTDPGRSAARPADAPKPAQSARQASGRRTIAVVVAATNAERVAAGCRVLRVDNRLNIAAQRHSVDMADRRRMSHTGGDGSRFTERIRAAGYPPPGAENIAFGQPTAASVVAAWMASSGHRRNIMNCAYTAIGVGFDARGNYWTQNFGF